VTRLYSAERFSTRAELLQGYNDDAGLPDYANREFADRSAVLVEDVRKAYYDLLPPDRRVVVFVLPRADTPEEFDRIIRDETAQLTEVFKDFTQ